MSKGSNTTTEKADPWGPQQPYLTRGFQEAGNLLDSGGPQYYDRATYTPFSAQSEKAMGMVEDRAIAGSPLNAGAQGLAQNTLDGQYLNSNPFMDNMYQQGADKITENVNAQFTSAGRTGSGAHVGRMTKELGDLYNNMYGSQYQQERQNQMNTMQIAPQLAETDYNDAARLGQVGQAVEGKAGEIIQDDMNRFNFYQQSPEQNLAQYIAAIQGNYGGTTSSTAKEKPSTLQTIGQVASIGAALSDRRLKDNIEPIGEYNGHKIYRWNWNDKAAELGLSGSDSGVIAQEVEEYAPYAVTEVSGYKAVIYSELEARA